MNSQRRSFAGVRYREFLMEYITQQLMVEVPLKGLGIAKQVQWLAHHRAYDATR
jgi:hypothetical protein